MEIIRIGVMNNFNQTEEEILQAEELKKQGYLPFVNTNSKTPIKYGPAIATINPDHEAAPRGSKTGTQGLKNAKLRAVVPRKLIIELFDVIEGKKSIQTRLTT